MKESIGSTQLFIIVVTLVILFSGIMALAINRANSFAVKDKLVNVIEKHGGFDMNAEIIGGSTDDALQEIVDSLQEVSYRQEGQCPKPTAGDNYTVVGYERNGTKTMGNDDSAFCILRYPGKNTNGTINVFYYKVVVFYHLDLPVVRGLFNFRVMGETKPLYK